MVAGKREKTAFFMPLLNALIAGNKKKNGNTKRKTTIVKQKKKKMIAIAVKCLNIA